METEPRPEGPDDKGTPGLWRRWRERPLTGLIGGDLALAGLVLVSTGLVFFMIAGGFGGSSAGAPAGAEQPSAGDSGDQALRFAQCMRENGVPSFPDPVDGGFRITPDDGFDPGSPEFGAAREACQDEAPEGLGPGSRPDGEMQEQVLAFAQCMRDNGVPGFPDPDTSGGGVRITPGEGGFDPDSPEFEAAREKCSEHLEGAIGGGMRRGGP